MSTIIGGSSALAQPSDEVVAARLKNAGAIEVKFISGEGTVHTLPNEKYYMRTTESKWNTDLPGVYRWEMVDNRYDYKNGQWVFTRSYFGGSWYDGVSNPTEQEIIAVLERSQAGYQGSVMEKPVFKLAEKPNWNWHTINSVEFNVDVVYYKKTSYTEVTKIHAVIPVRLYRDCGGGQYNSNAKEIYKDAAWLNVRMDYFPGTGNEENLQSITLTESEANNLQTAAQLAEKDGN